MNKARHPLEVYAESYASMAKDGNGRVDCKSVEIDIRQNMIPVTSAITPDGFTWIGRDAWITGEDFKYRAKVLCSFPKSNGKVRFIVEDNGRIFIQREEQIEYIEISPFGAPKNG